MWRQTEWEEAEVALCQTTVAVYAKMRRLDTLIAAVFASLNTTHSSCLITALPLRFHLLESAFALACRSLPIGQQPQIWGLFSNEITAVLPSALLNNDTSLGSFTTESSRL